MVWTVGGGNLFALPGRRQGEACYTGLQQMVQEGSGPGEMPRR